MLYFLSLLVYVLSTVALQATPLMCTMCTAAVASGLAISKILGVDDTVIGIWTGAILLAMSEWALFWLDKKNIKNTIIKILTFLSSYLLLIPLYVSKTPSLIFGQQKFFGIDSFIFSVIIGSCVLSTSLKLYNYIKNKNDKPHFPYERVALPFILLFITSIIFYLITK